MKFRARTLAFISFLSVAFSVATAQSSDSLRAMKLLAPEVGWAASESQLLWTNDAGEHWNDITPPTSSNRRIGCVFFSNTSTGWVLLSHADDKAEQQFEIALTDNGGETWSVSSVVLPWDRYAEDFSGGGNIYFVDQLHGWMLLEILSASLAPARLLSTTDGGKTWKPTPDDPGRSGVLCFFGIRDGVLTGGSQDTELWVTHDGSTTWQQALLQPPSQIFPADFATYGAPVCEDAEHGFLPVTYTPTIYPHHESFSAAVVLFATDDAGRNWRVDKLLTSLPDMSHGYTVVSSLADSSFTAITIQGGMTKLMTVGPDHVSSELTTTRLGSPSEMNFVDVSSGWALTADGLFSTLDSGASWTRILGTAEFQKRLPRDQSLSGSKAVPPLSLAALGDNSVANTSSQGIDIRLGFDTKLVPSAANMLTWWKFSPYHDYQISLAGAANHKTNPSLDEDWTTTVKGYGWGLWPVWVGPQAPCVNQTKLATISPTNPYKQGQDQATQAIAALKGVSGTFAGTVIYYDMENYNTSNKTCVQIVINFLNGWINGLHSAKPTPYKAAVYGNIAPAALNFARLNPLPDAAWITWGPTNVPPNIPHVSIWGLATATASLCDPFSKPSCPLWSTDQRMHQYAIDTKDFPHFETWGGAKLEIDPDIVDAAVGLSSKGKKAYTFTYTAINFPDAASTLVYGINNAGQVVGSYIDHSNNEHGFLYENGEYTSLNYPGASATGATAINSSGQVAGTYYTKGTNGYALYAFTCQVVVGVGCPKASYSSISVPGTSVPDVVGINDNGQIAGSYQDCNYGFLYKISTKVSVTFQYNPSVNGGGNTCVRGVNGDNLIVGDSGGGSSPPFLYNPVTDSFSALSFPNGNNGSGGLNNNLQIVSGEILYDYTSNSASTLRYGGMVITNTAINDLSQVVGFYYDSNLKAHGYLATPKQ